MTRDARSGCRKEPCREAGETEFRPDRRLSRAQRLTQSRHFAEAYRQGHRHVGRYMVLWVRHAEDGALRLGVVASRRVGKAVQRARAKRRLREAYRRNRHRFNGTCDVILVARSAILSADWLGVERELLALAERARLVSMTHE
ncbi:MAG: ribonuclease P protein component [Kiritimatiellae bacterium]|nr:ribonuclease P protein component [Kiritimatiellia bacterium]